MMTRYFIRLTNNNEHSILAKNIEDAKIIAEKKYSNIDAIFDENNQIVVDYSLETDTE